MGLYFSPGNKGFESVLNGIYVDKTEMIEIINRSLDTSDKLTCISRPRRFGKTYTAKMLSAYYDMSCDSKVLFDGLKISGSDTYLAHLNQYYVVSIDITGFISAKKDSDNIVDLIRESVVSELRASFPDITGNSLEELLVNISESSGRKFFFIIDEWDALFREYQDDEEIHEEYINFLRAIFKNGNVTDRSIVGAFMTGILPIKKYGHQSAISDFREYTMIQPSLFSEFVGFTKKDIDYLAQHYSLNRASVKKWYDGYSFPKVGEIYNPNSVCQAARTGVYDTYWSKTETFEALLQYINMDIEGLQADIIQMLGGNDMPVDTSTFQNDMTSVHGKDDILSLLIHLGYLAYDNESQKARIPNEEIRREFVSTIRVGSHETTNRIIRNSDQLLADTIDGNEEAVARAIEEAHDAGTLGVSPLFYNDEQALRSVVKVAYISAVNDYIKVEELPSGRGYADLVYIPKNGAALPVLVIELKKNDSAEGAIGQIKDKKYFKVFEGIKGDVILCGINYDAKTKKHECKIERITL